MIKPSTISRDNGAANPVLLSRADAARESRRGSVLSVTSLFALNRGTGLLSSYSPRVSVLLSLLLLFRGERFFSAPRGDLGRSSIISIGNNHSRAIWV